MVVVAPAVAVVVSVTLSTIAPTIPAVALAVGVPVAAVFMVSIVVATRGRRARRAGGGIRG
jgi:hypothetical protein